MRSLTPALVSLHGAGRPGSYDAALLDVAQDHLLWLLAELGCFEGNELILKGGTSLRKCRLGSGGRFSTDLDFAAPSEDTVLSVCETIDGATVAGFTFSLSATRGDGRHWILHVDHQTLGRPAISSSVEFARRPLVLPPERLAFVPLPIHKAYGVTLPVLPIVAQSEACAEKLARYRRTSLGRDVYDLAKFADRQLDESAVRRLWVLKVWSDVVDDHRGEAPLRPADVLMPRQERDFAPESIGALTQRVDLVGWERHVRARFAFLDALDADEQRWAACNPRDRGEVERAICDGGWIAP